MQERELMLHVNPTHTQTHMHAHTHFATQKYIGIKHRLKHAFSQSENVSVLFYFMTEILRERGTILKRETNASREKTSHNLMLPVICKLPISITLPDKDAQRTQ